MLTYLDKGMQAIHAMVWSAVQHAKCMSMACYAHCACAEHRPFGTDYGILISTVMDSKLHSQIGLLEVTVEHGWHHARTHKDSNLDRQA